MAVPKFDELMLPLLNYAVTFATHRDRDGGLLRADEPGNAPCPLAGTTWDD